jgi:hypothetical protein
MNLFILSLIQKEIAESMMDKHVSKILLEAVQMLCSARRIVEPDDDVINERIYKLAHKNHPVTIWCRKSRANFVWALDLAEELHNEWRFRYGHPETKIHKSFRVAMFLRENIPNEDAFEEVGLTPFAQAMPDKYKSDDPVLSYRNYYMSEEKQKIASWSKKRSKPAWYVLNDHSLFNKDLRIVIGRHERTLKVYPAKIEKKFEYLPTS